MPMHSPSGASAMSGGGGGAKSNNTWHAVDGWLYLQCLSSDCSNTVAYKETIKNSMQTKQERACQLYSARHDVL